MKKKTLKHILTWFVVLVFAFVSLLPVNLVFAETAPVNTYYVAVDGSDANPGTIDAPFASITYAFQQLASGDTLLIREGTYSGYLQIIDKQDVTIKNYEGEKVVIQQGATSVGYLAYIGGSTEADGTPKTRNATISGISFTLENAQTSAGMYIDASSNTKITNCEFDYAQGGLVLRTGADNFEISSNIFHDCKYAYGGILLFNATNGKVYNNVIYNSYFGVLFYGATAANNEIYNNTFYGNTFDVGVSNVSGVGHDNTFKNNIFSSVIQNQNHDNPDALVDNFMSLNSFDNNCYNSTTMSDDVVTNDGLTLQQLKDNSIETNGFSADPKFLNTATNEFQIGRGSSCIGTGAATLMPAADILGQSQTSPPDVGAYLHADRVNYYVSTTGDDANAGTDAAPFKTIGYALSVMQSGDYLFIKGGTYAEGIDITGKSGIVIKNYQADLPVLTQLVNIQDSSDITIAGFALNNSIVIGNSRNVKVTKIDVNGGHIVVVPGSGTYTDGYEISSCSIHDFQGEGAILIYNGKNGNISNNIIFNNKYQAMLIEGGESVNNSLYNNTQYNNGCDLLIVYSTSIGNPANNTFKNNIFSNGLVMGNDNFYTTNTFDYNFYNLTVMTDGIGAGYSNVYDAEGNFVETLWPALSDLQARGVEQNGFLGSPSFMNTAINDYRLSVTSECIGKGTSLGAPLYDIKGVRRNEPYDMGAYKFTGEVSDYYVAVTGDDANAGTMEAPFATIQHAIDLVGVGGTVYIKSGTYDESLGISNSKGNPENRYTIRNVQGETVVLSSGNQKETAISIAQGSGYWNIEGLNINGYTKNGIEIIEGSNNVKLSNISISNVGEYGIYADNSSNTALSNIKVENVQNGISLTASTGWGIEKTYINNASGIAAGFNASNENRVTSSIFAGSGTGISISGSSNLAVYNNDFYNNSQRDMVLDQASSANTVKNNIYGSAGAAYLLEIMDEGSLDNDLDYNSYNSTAAAVSVKYTSELTLDQFKALGKEANGILADPMFTDPANGDFLLKPYSPCTGKGIKDAASPVIGYDGASFGIPMDIGACFSPFSLKSYYVSVDGDDNNDGSIEHPWKTIKKGMTSMKQSDTLYIRGGTYNERIDMYDKQGRSYTYFTVKNYNGENVLLDSQFSQDVGIKFNNCSYWNIYGINFTNYSGAAIWVTNGSNNIVMENLEISNIDEPEFVQSGTEGVLGDGENNTVRNCYIHDIGQTRRSQADHGIYIGYGARGWVFDSNRIDNAPGGGIQMYGKPTGGDDITIINNVISNCKYGLIMTMGIGNIISNNTFYNNWEYDLYMDWWINDSIIQNNIFYNDLPKGMTVKVEDRANLTTKDYEINPVPFAFLYDQVCNNTFRNNIVFNENFSSRVVEGSTIKPLQDYLNVQTLNTIENLYEGNPGFVDSYNYDFELQDDSQCINKGVDEYAPDVDILDQSRVGLPDLGAYECQNPAVITPTPTPTEAPTPTPDPYDFINVFADGAVTVDGDINEAGWDVSHELTQGKVDGVTNNIVKFGTQWDTDNLYVAFDVTDSSLVSNEAGYPWESDSAEIYIDGNNRNGAYDGHAVQYIFRWYDATTSTNAGDIFVYNNDAATINGIQYVAKAKVDGLGYTMEISIPWADIGGLSVEAAKTIGFTAHVNDCDNADGTLVFDCLGYTPDFNNDWQGGANWADMTLAADVPTPTPTDAPTPTPTDAPTPTPTNAPTPTPTNVPPAPTATPAPTPTTAPTPTPVEPHFTDVDGNWAHKAIMSMAKAGVLEGYSDGTARPNANATRAEFVAFITKLMKVELKTSVNFTDTTSSAWYMKYLAAAVENGWVDGRTDGSFGPDENITREEAMVIIARVIESLGVTSDSTESTLALFSDSDEISGWAKADAAKLVGLGIIKGSSGRLNPKAEITRAEICEILNRIMENYLNK